MAGSLKHLVFLGKMHMKSPQIANYYGDSELLKCSNFSTAGSFGDNGKVAKQLRPEEENTTRWHAAMQPSSPP